MALRSLRVALAVAVVGGVLVVPAVAFASSPAVEVSHAITCSLANSSVTVVDCDTDAFEGGSGSEVFDSRYQSGGTFNADIFMSAHVTTAGTNMGPLLEVCLRYHANTTGVVEYGQFVATGNFTTTGDQGLSIMVLSGTAGSPTLKTPDYWWYVSTAPNGTAVTCTQALDPGVPDTTTPQACATWTPSAPNAGETISFDGSCSAHTTRWAWSDDGGTATAYSTTKTHTVAFGTDGDHTVQVLVKNTNVVPNTTADVTYTITIGGAGGDSDCGAWWHLFCYITSALEYLFVPADTGSLSALWGDLSTKLPFSLAVTAVTFLPDALTAMSDDVTGNEAANECTALLDPWQISGNPGSDLFSGTPLSGYGGTADAICADSTGAAQLGFGDWLAIVRTAIYFLFLLGVAWSLWHLGKEVLAG